MGLRLDFVADGIISNSTKDSVVRNGLEHFRAAKIEKGLKKSEVNAIRKFIGALIGFIMSEDEDSKKTALEEMREIRKALPNVPVNTK
jgi:hypothetical protein